MLTAKRIDDTIEKNVKPNVMPNAPVPINTNIIAEIILVAPEIIAMTGNPFVFREATTTERKRLLIEDEIINRIITMIKLKSIAIVSSIKSLKTKMSTLHTRIPPHVNSNDALTNIFVFSIFCSEKLLLTKR
jgi:hypothetical protein